MLSYTKVVQGEGEGLPQRGAWERPDARACFVFPTWVSRRFSGVCRKVFPRPVELHGRLDCKSADCGGRSVSGPRAVSPVCRSLVPTPPSASLSIRHRKS